MRDCIGSDALNNLSEYLQMMSTRTRDERRTCLWFYRTAKRFFNSGQPRHNSLSANTHMEG